MPEIDFKTLPLIKDKTRADHWYSPDRDEVFFLGPGFIPGNIIVESAPEAEAPVEVAAKVVPTGVDVQPPIVESVEVHIPATEDTPAIDVKSDKDSK